MVEYWNSPLPLGARRSDSIAPSYPGMPNLTSPPSKAGPAGQEAVSMRPRPATTTSVLVPTSTIMDASPASRSRPQAAMAAAVSAPTWLAISGMP